MSLKAIITAAVLASSTVASAHTFTANVHGSWGFSAGPQVRDHRGSYDQDRNEQGNGYWNQAPEAHSWTSLGSFSAEVINDVVEFRIDRRMGDVSQLMFSGDVSKTRIQGIRLNYADGRSEVIQTDRYIGDRGTVTTIPYSKNFVVNVHGRVTSVQVTVSKPAGSVFSVLAI